MRSNLYLERALHDNVCYDPTIDTHDPRAHSITPIQRFGVPLTRFSPPARCSGRDSFSPRPRHVRRRPHEQGVPAIAILGGLPFGHLRTDVRRGLRVANV